MKCFTGSKEDESSLESERFAIRLQDKQACALMT